MQKLLKKKKNKDLKPNEQKPHSPIKGLNKLKDRLFPEKTFLINMELRNGFHTSFMIQPRTNTFKYNSGEYIIDTDLKYYSVSSKLWCLDYHQDFVIPIRREIPVSEINKAISSTKIEVENATNPLTLSRFMESKIAEGIMKGQQIDEYLKKIFVVIIIAACASVLHFIVYVFKSGMLDSIKI